MIGHGALPLPYRTFLGVKEEVVVVSMLVRTQSRARKLRKKRKRQRKKRDKKPRLELTTRALKWNMTGARRKRGSILSGFYGCFGVEQKEIHFSTFFSLNFGGGYALTK